MKTFARVGLAAVVLAGVTASSGGTALIPATFDEYVGISWYTIQGASLEVPESVNLTVTQGQTDNRGSGTAVATASGVLPLVTELDVSIFGGTNMSGIGATASVWTRYQFSLDPDAGGLPANVPIVLTFSGWVTVDTSLPDGFSQGQTLARIMFPGGQRQTANYDAQGGHEGYFSFDEAIPLNVSAGTAQTITIYLSSHGQGAGTDFFYHGHAFLDPVIQIDPSFEFKDQFQVVYSQGIVVPEPAPHAGDANNNGFVDVGDLGILAFNWGQSGKTWAEANFTTPDTTVDVGDLGVLAFNWGWIGDPAGAGNVPEPATMSLLALGGLGLIRRRPMT